MMRDDVKDAFRQFIRNERWGTCIGCPRDGEGRALPELCLDTYRSDHQLTLSDLVEKYEQSLA